MLHELVQATTQKSESHELIRVVSWTIKCSISVSPLHFLSFLTVPGAGSRCEISVRLRLPPSVNGKQTTTNRKSLNFQFFSFKIGQVNKNFRSQSRSWSRSKWLRPHTRQICFVTESANPLLFLAVYKAASSEAGWWGGGGPGLWN